MAKNFTRRQFLAATGVSALGGLLAACAPQVVTQVVNQTQVVTQQVTAVVNQTSEVTKVVEVTAVAPTGPKNSRGLVLPVDALPLDKQVWNNAIGTVGGGFGHIMESLYNRTYEHNAGYECLTSLDSDFNTIGEGADSWKESADGLSWDFTLHKGLMWSDGNPVKASDWVFTLQRSLSQQNPPYDFAWFYFDIKNASQVATGKATPDQLGISAVDDLTLRITTEAPTAYLPSLGTWFGVASPLAYNNSMGPTNNWALDPTKYISCGPFILTAFNRGVEYDWGSNTKYTGARINYFEKIIEKPRPTGLAAYMAGDLQMYSVSGDTPPAEGMLVQANPVLRAESHPNPPTGTDYMGFNMLQKQLKTSAGAMVDNPFLDINVRMAMCKAIDKDTLVGQIYNGLAYPAYGLIPHGFPNFNAALQTEDVNVFDVPAAQALLAKTKFPGGKGFPVFDFYLRQPSPAYTNMALALQARWKTNLGINVNIKPADFQGFTQAAFTDKTAPLYYVAYSMDYYDPATFMNVFKASSVGGRHPYDNTDWTTAYVAANATIDTTKRLQLLQASEKDMVDSAAWYFLTGGFGITLAPCNLVGPTTEPNKDGYRFYGGGGPGCYHCYEGMYWSNSTCRASLNK